MLFFLIFFFKKYCTLILFLYICLAFKQKIFADVLQEPSKIYTKTIISPLTLTIGDEFQAVLSNAENLFQMMNLIEHRMRKISLRYGLGIGQIDTEINHQSAIGMDGPAFHFARQAVELAR